MIRLIAIISKFSTRTTPLMLVIALALAGWGGFGVHKSQAITQVLSFSDTLNDSAPSVDANHTIKFTAQSGADPGDTIIITFPVGFTGFDNIATLSTTSFDFADDGSDLTIESDCGLGPDVAATNSLQTITFTICSGTTIASDSVVTIEVGTHAGHEASGDIQIINPASSSESFRVDVGGTFGDIGTTMVAIVDHVNVTASVSGEFQFTVSGRASGLNCNSDEGSGGDTTDATASASATALPFGNLTGGASKSLGQDLTVTGNMTGGFTVTVSQSQNLTSSNGDDIDSFDDGIPATTPASWSSPAGLIASESTYGHFGFTSADDLNTNEFSNATNYAGFITSGNAIPDAIFKHDGPADGSTQNSGATTVCYKIEIDDLQEAAADYTNEIIYVATPVF